MLNVNTSVKPSRAEITFVKTVTTFSERLALALRDPDHGMTQAELAKAVGYKNQSSIGNILTDPNRFGSSKTYQIAHALNVDPLWLAEGLGQMRPTHKTSAKQNVGVYNLSSAPPTRIPVPVISLIRAGHMKEIGELPGIGEGETWESPDNKLGPRGWAHIVEGDSMDDGTDKAIPEGWLIFVDPDIAPHAGHYVIAKDVSTQSATFKKLTFDGGRWYLKPLNRQYQAIEIDSPELRVIGVVTEARPPSRKLV